MTPEQEKHAETLERMLRCLNIPLPADVAALEAGIAALRSSPPPALAVDEVVKVVQALAAQGYQHWEAYEDLKVGDVLSALAGVPGCYPAVDRAYAAVQASRAAEPGTCATCQHYQPEDPIGGHCTDVPPNPMAHRGCGPSFGCIFHKAQEPSR